MRRIRHIYFLGIAAILGDLSLAQTENDCPEGTVKSSDGACTFGNVLPGYSKTRFGKPMTSETSLQRVPVSNIQGPVKVPSGVAVIPIQQIPEKSAPSDYDLVRLEPEAATQVRSRSVARNSGRNHPDWSEGQVGIGIVAGTPGIGGEVRVATSNRMVLRGSYTALDWGIDKSIDGVEYDADVDLSNGGGFVDFYPFDSGFNISAGAYIGQKTVNIDATPTTDVRIGENDYSPEEVGSLSGEIEYDNFAPYVGVGYDHTIKPLDLNLHVRAGIVIAGDADVTLTATDGTPIDDQAFEDDLSIEIDNIKRESEDFQLMPVITVGAAKWF